MPANILLILIIGSACFVLTGVIMTAVRLVRIIRRERSLADKIQAYWQFKGVDFHITEEDAEATPRSTEISQKS